MAGNLITINGYYYFWKKTPVDLKQYHDSTHIKLSLKTKNRKQAKAIEASYSFWLQRFLSIIRSRCFSQNEIERFLSEAPANLLKSSQHSSQLMRTSVMSLYKIYEDEHIRANQWREKTRNDQQQMIRIFVELLGSDCHIQKIERPQLLIIKESICRLPPNMTKDRRFKNKSLSEILKMKDFKTISHVRAHRIVTHLQAFLRWCYKNGHLREDVSATLAMTRKRDRKQRDERTIYSDADLERMFATEVFKGNLSINRPENFFLPLIAMYSGMRLNEIAQLFIDDIQNIDGIYCFNIIDDNSDKVVKNSSSCRKVPVHPMLLEMGLLDFYHAIQEKGCPRMWMNLSKREDNFGKKFSACFQRLNRKFITNDPKKVFHSFRHGFATQLKEKGIRTEIIAELLGHSHNSITLDRYGKSFKAQTLYDAVCHIEYSIPLQQLQTTVERIISNL